ncbi:phage tail sheath subtilisin-like domain-containing protein [Mycobacterium sp. 3519A]|uniref:phage tail sheath family protein n=1 Tax=Mycobacterium sp. 3519A TaxID=2057184 RepID=UPI000C7C3498|nr:phage tail sheath subtilisin-like domain-containing protein [Mycobacterium sp. 3519A]
MPDDVSHPGVFIEESPAGHPIAGVATSTTAFLGQAAMGPTDKPVSVFDLTDFIDQFGPLDLNYPMGFAVRDFFANGGSQAVIVRLYENPSVGNPAAVLKAGTVHPVTLVATSPGDWANSLEAQVKHDGDAGVATDLGLTTDDLFSLRVRARPGGPQEKFLNLTVKDTARRVDRVLARESALVRIADPDALVEPPGESVDGTGTATWDHVQPTDVGHPSAPLDLAAYAGDRAARTGKYQLAHVDLVNLVCVSANTLDHSVPAPVYRDILDYCVERRAFLLVDAPADWTRADLTDRLSQFQSIETAARNAAVFYPRLLQKNPLRGNQIEPFAPCGAVAGVIARTDATRGVWKAPAGADASLAGVVGLSENLSDAQAGPLNQHGINVIRTFPTVGPVVWGARTMRGADVNADEFKYIPVRRTALFIEESLQRGLQWAMFEPNDEPLWAQIRLTVGAFMNDLFRKGAFQGQTERDAYFVNCGRQTTTDDDIDNGVLNVVVGFAPLRPAEFVILQLQLIAGQKGPP